jgi:hypothetical protein
VCLSDLHRSVFAAAVFNALLKGIVNLHGGIISAKSDGPGTGSTFTVELPVVRTVASPLVNSIYWEGEQGERGQSSSQDVTYTLAALNDPFERVAVKNVVIVDDAPLNRKMLMRYCAILYPVSLP